MVHCIVAFYTCKNQTNTVQNSKPQLILKNNYIVIDHIHDKFRATKERIVLNDVSHVTTEAEFLRYW